MPDSAAGRKRAKWFGIAALHLVLCSATPAWAVDQQQVLVLYATRRDARISVLGDRALPRLLERGLGHSIDYYAEYLDLARFPEEGYQEAVRDFLLHKYKAQRFDLVIAMHEIALRFVARHRDELFPGTPVIFSSSAPSTSRLPNSTGLITVPNFGGTVTLAAALQPRIRRIVVVSGSDGRDAEMERQARAQLRSFEHQFEFTYLQGLPTRELERQLSALPPDAIVYYLLVNRDGTGESFHPLEYLDRVVAASSVPVYCWVDSGMSSGIVGGYMRSQPKVVEAIGGLALRVLRGEPADAIPTLMPDLHLASVDWRQLRRWNIDTTRVPAGTTVLFEELSVWDKYKHYVVAIVGLLLAQTMLIAALLVQRKRRRTAEAKAGLSEVELKDSYDRIRHLAGRLLGAQESERARIARDLHDDVSQQLALLSIDLELLNATANGNSGLVRAALDRAHTVARTVHDLSHRLHPAKLRLIGLVPALQSLQREMTRSHLEVTFLYKNLPAHLEPELTLCLYRVVQEALQNALKHSEATEVLVDLNGVPGGLELTIADDGVGFDPAAAWSSGLGLISMRERIEAAGGNLSLDAVPGEGTRLHMAVPL